MTATVSLTATQSWEKTSWHGETAWIATHGGVCAIVSERRARLIYFGPADGAHNLLNAPLPLQNPTPSQPEPNFGGHRFWLGPQKRWGWPPPREWEYSAAKYVSASESSVTIHLPRIDPAYPAIVREYAWEGSRLRCTARWLDDGRPWFGLHVIAVDAPLSLVTRLTVSRDAPLGLLAAEMTERVQPLALPHPAVTIGSDFATVRSGAKIAKLAFSPQPLDLEREKRWKLSLLPGPHTGTVITYPDSGYLSQVWVGEETHSFAEIEQLTPYLKADDSGFCSSTVYLEANPPSS